MIVRAEGISLANLPAKRFLERDIFGLPCSKTHMTV